MGFYKHNLLNHFTELLPVLQRAGAEASLNLRNFHLELRAGGRSYTLCPQFVKRENGERKYTPEFDADVARFIGWCPYFNRRWELSNEKLKFKAYALANGLRTPEYSDDPDAEMNDVVVKKSNSSFAQNISGPFRRSKQHPLDAGGGEFYERFIPGRIAKIFYWDDRAICLELEKSATVTGDGRRIIKQLLEPRVAVRDRLKRVTEYLDFVGKSIEDVVEFGVAQQVDFRYGSAFNVGSDLENIDLTKKPIPELAPQLDAIGDRLWEGIPPEIRSGTLYTVDAVLDADDKLWLLEMNSNPFIHPFLYPVMLEALFTDKAVSQAAFAPRFPGFNPASTNEIFQLAVTQFNSGAVDQALALLAKILSEQPNHPAALFYSGRALVQGGRINEGRDRLDALVRTAPRDNLYVGPATELLAAITRTSVIPSPGRPLEAAPMGVIPGGNQGTGH